jgi:hypothetical protein
MINIGVIVYDANIQSVNGIGKIQVLEINEDMKHDAKSTRGRYSHASSLLKPLLAK